MLLKQRIFFGVATFLCGGVAQAQNQQFLPPTSTWVTLRLPEQGFTMQMPPDWEQLSPTPQGSSVKLQIRSPRNIASSRIGLATCVVAIDAQPETRNRTQASISARIQSGPLNHSAALALFESISAPQVLESRLTHFGNLPAYLVVGRGFDEIQNSPITNSSMMAVTMQPGRMIAVSCSALTGRNTNAEAAWDFWQPLFTAIMNTFLPNG